MSKLRDHISVLLDIHSSKLELYLLFPNQTYF